MAKKEKFRTLKLEEMQEQHNTKKIVKAKVISISDKGFCFLSSGGIDKIFLHFNQLKSKNIQSINLSNGDEFEVEVSKGEKGDKVDKIISYNPISKTESPEEMNISSSIDNFEGSLNFYTFLHKRI